MPVLRAQADDADRGEEHRGRQAQAEQVHRQVALARADQHPWHQAPLAEGGHVGALRVLVARAAGDVRQDRRRQRVRGAGLKLGERHRQARHRPAKAGEVDVQLQVAVGRSRPWPGLGHRLTLLMAVIVCPRPGHSNDSRARRGPTEERYEYSERQRLSAPFRP